MLSICHANSPYTVDTIGTQSSPSDIGLYGYDTAGNRLSNSTKGQNVKYGLISKAVNISQDGVSTSIHHAPGGRHYLRTNSNGSKTFYLPGMDYKIDANDNATKSIRISAKGYSPFVQVDINFSGTDNTYFIQDHLGSPVALVNNDDTVNKRNRYGVWGQMTEATGVSHTPTDDDAKFRGYTGHELMAKFNMGYWNGRIFDYEIATLPQTEEK